MAWISLIPTVLSAIVQLAKLLYDLSKDNRAEDVKECGLAIEAARASGDVSKLTALIEKLKRGSKCT
jgi:hypothetical protein